MSRRDSRSQDNAEFGHFMSVVFCRGTAKKCTKKEKLTSTAIVVLIKPFVEGRCHCRPHFLKLSKENHDGNGNVDKQKV